MIRPLSTCTILVVDDLETNVAILLEILGDDYQVSVATDGPSALEAVHEALPDLILLDIIMPGMDGYEICRRLKEDPATADVPVIFVTAMGEIEDEAKGLALGAIDYLAKPVSPAIVRARVKNHLELKLAKEELEIQNVVLEFRVQERTRELTMTQEVTIESLASLAEYRDPDTGGHIRRTQHYVQALANHMCIDPRFAARLRPLDIDRLYKSAPLHDIGKVGVSDSILLKPGPLTAEEFELMKQHTIFGRDAIMKAEMRLGGESFLRVAREIAHYHHERWDGTGYPEGLCGEAIPLSARLMAVADVYDALISRRVYKPPFPHGQAVEIMMAGTGTHFDPAVVEAFGMLHEEFRRIALTFADFADEVEALNR